jgi:hypothetical protein
LCRASLAPRPRNQLRRPPNRREQENAPSRRVFPTWFRRADLSVVGFRCEAIKRIGGTLPENPSPVEHIKQVEKRIKQAPPTLALDGPEAKGLVGEEPKTPDRKE